MVVYILVFAGALVLAIGATPAARYLAPRVGLIDRPEARRLNKSPVPRMGGVAIYVAVIVAAVVLGERYNFAQFGGILIGATGISFMGLIDDRWGLRPLIKIVGQILAALLLWSSGITVGTFEVPVLNLLVTVFWVGYITNAINLVDNMDGLASGVAAIASAFFALMCGFTGQYLVGSLSVAVLGACLGFLGYNLNPASIFMGDSGSMLIGINIAAMLLLFSEHTDPRWMLGALMIFGLPICDTALAVYRRLASRQSFFVGDNLHLHHQMVSHGLTTKQTVAVLYVLATFFAMAGLNVLFVRLRYIAVVYALVISNLMVLATAFGLHRPEREASKFRGRHLPPDPDQ